MPAQVEAAIPHQVQPEAQAVQAAIPQVQSPTLEQVAIPQVQSQTEQIPQPTRPSLNPVVIGNSLNTNEQQQQAVQNQSASTPVAIGNNLNAHAQQSVQNQSASNPVVIGNNLNAHAQQQGVQNQPAYPNQQFHPQQIPGKGYQAPLQPSSGKNITINLPGNKSSQSVTQHQFPTQSGKSFGYSAQENKSGKSFGYSSQENKRGKSLGYSSNGGSYNQYSNKGGSYYNDDGNGEFDSSFYNYAGQNPDKDYRQSNNNRRPIFNGRIARGVRRFAGKVRNVFSRWRRPNQSNERFPIVAGIRKRFGQRFSRNVSHRSRNYCQKCGRNYGRRGFRRGLFRGSRSRNI